MKGKCIIFSAPSGAGKTTIVRHLLNRFPELAFSISACSRPIRKHEVDGKDYYFLTPDEFRAKIKEEAFLEWEEVYEGRYYGTLKEEIDRIWKAGKTVIFDVDVVGGVNIKKYFGEQALSIFVQVPSVDVLKERLVKRSTETEEDLQRRISKAQDEMQYADQFDVTLMNNELDEALKKAEALVRDFLNKEK